MEPNHAFFNRSRPKTIDSTCGSLLDLLDLVRDWAKGNLPTTRAIPSPGKLDLQ